MTGRPLHVWFDHGLGDCCHFALLLQLYKKRGYDVYVHYEQNKSEVWQIAGTPYCELSGTPYHQWGYPDHFNVPSIDHDGSGNKIYHNLNRLPLPPIGDADYLWDELARVTLSGEVLYSRGIEAEVERFLRNLPRPIILVHTAGSNLQPSKNLPDNMVADLYERLLDGSQGSIILLDWDNRVPRLASARVRHLRTDWGHIDLTRLWHLMVGADLMIGIDSGPLHFSAFTDLPCLGVFHGHYPTSVVLPRQRTALLTRSMYRKENVSKRHRWNVLEYNDDMPTAEEITRHALRMLWTSKTGPRYFRNGELIGRDLVLQQMIRDWCRASTSLSPFADRHNSMDFLFRRIKQLHHAPRIVETGCIRSYEDWSAGYSTYLFAMLTDGTPDSSFETIDNDLGNIKTAIELTAPFASRTVYHNCESVSWLKSRCEPIDVLYLDSWDADVPGHAEHGLFEIKAAVPTLHATSIVVYDDTTYNNGWKGKGSLGVPYLLERGWQVVMSGYQVILEKSK